MIFYKLTLYESEIESLLPIREREDVAINILIFIKAICYEKAAGSNGSQLQCFYYPDLYRIIWGEANRSIHSLLIPWKIEKDVETGFFIPKYRELPWKMEYCDMLISLFNDMKEHDGYLDDIYDIYDYYSDMLQQFQIDNRADQQNLWIYFKSLYTYEPGYVRYDYDPENEDGHMHPMNHLDINYSKHGTYKIGLRRSVSHHDLAELMDATTECYYAEKVD